MATGVRFLALAVTLAVLSEGQFVFDLPEDASCLTPDDQEGRCVGLRSCRPVLSLLVRPVPAEVIAFLRASVCGFSSRLPDVCCPTSERTPFSQK